jgi:cytosine/adenosine deaminase-related metal-dependent hydrolase
MRARRLTARWLLPIEGPPLEHGALLIGVNGRIDAVGPDAKVPRPPDVPAEDYGDAILLPGLINTHTHLELTGFEGQVRQCEFPAWIRQLRELKDSRTGADYLAAARRGVAACYASGVTTIADTGDSGTVIQALAESEGSGIAYQEVFGPDPAQLEESLAGIRDRVGRLSHWTRDRVWMGVSPHAPYSVSGRLLMAVAAWAAAEGLPLAMHVAESPQEVAFLAEGVGPFAQAWRERGIPLPSKRGQSPVAWLAAHGGLSHRMLCIHAVQIAPGDIDCIAHADAAVAHCPQSNREHGHGAAPLRALLDAGVRVGLGTDSVVSVGRLDMFAEARLARAQAQLSAEMALELCTLGGARALELESETGSLRVGKWGDCVVIKTQPASQGKSPAERVLEASPEDVLLTCVGGREVYRAL